MIYLLVFVLLFVVELLYFQLADHFNIIDKPNERSSHTSITLRGGGIVFYLGAIVFFISSGFHYPWFFLGLTLMTVISFLDDIFTLSNKIRLLVHFFSVLLLVYQLDIFTVPWYYLFIIFVFIVGVINAYNFMDGINGITACYSLAVGGLLMLVNRKIGFVEQDLLVYSLLGVLVFTFFNFRNKAKCFAGDVGAISIVFILIFALGLLVISTGKFIYLLFLAVYGIDAIFTILQRIYLKKNIFEAHRMHLYQYLGNEAGINKLFVSLCYGAIQFAIGYFVIMTSQENVKIQILISFIILISLSVFYVIVKNRIYLKYVKQ